MDLAISILMENDIEFACVYIFTFSVFMYKKCGYLLDRAYDRLFRLSVYVPAKCIFYIITLIKGGTFGKRIGRSELNKIYSSNQPLKETETETVTELFVSEMDSKYSTYSLIALIFLLAYGVALVAISGATTSPLSTSPAPNNSASQWVSILTVVYVTILGIDYWTLSYRVKNGYFGQSKAEALELIKFIKSHADKDNFNDSDGPKKIFRRRKLEDESKEDVKEGVVI